LVIRSLAAEVGSAEPVVAVWASSPDVSTVLNVVGATAAVTVPLVWLDSSAVSLACAAATADLAEATCASNEVVSSCARVWPTATCWPTVAETLRMLPPTGKLRFAWLIGWIVPGESRVASTSARSTLAVR
jgi:hypothetical protein